VVLENVIGGEEPKESATSIIKVVLAGATSSPSNQELSGLIR
jgi:hypothetical protein